MKSHWYATAARVITEALAKLPAGADKRAVLQAVDSAYPFCVRRMWPYKKWLEARRDLLYLHNRQMFPKTRRAAEAMEEKRQGGLF